MLTVESWPIDRLVEYARNPRRNDEQVDRMVGAIREFGFRIPIVAKSDGAVVDGHLRLKAARRLGLTQVPVALADELTPAQVKAFRLLANKSASWAQWDEELLRCELEELQSLGFDLDLTGFSALEIGKLGVEGGETTEDEIPEPPAVAVTQPGDVWLLGDQRLVCGDSTDPAVIALACEGRTAKLFHTDSPYGVNYVATKNGIPRSGFRNASEQYGDIANDDLQGEKLQGFLEAVFRACLPHLDHAAWYLWHAQIGGASDPTASAMASIGALIHRVVIWAKPGFVLSRSGMYHWAHEPCFYGWIKGQQPAWLGDKSQRTIWEIGRDGVQPHPTAKPVELFAIPMRNHLHRGELALEPFAGSGSQVIAAEQLERRCAAVEMEPRYCDVIVARWEKLTGRKADRGSL